MSVKAQVAKKAAERGELTSLDENLHDGRGDTNHGRKRVENEDGKMEGEGCVKCTEMVRMERREKVVGGASERGERVRFK